MNSTKLWAVGIGIVIAIALFSAIPTAFAIFLIGIILLKVFDKGLVRTPDEVLYFLERMHSGEIDDYGWDGFINVPIRDPRLDAIRDQCEKIWAEDSVFLYRDTEGEYRLNESGKDAIETLIAQCQKLKAESSYAT